MAGQWAGRPITVRQIHRFLISLAWNARNPEQVAPTYIEDSEWRNRDVFNGRQEIVEFPRAKFGGRVSEQ